jgi:redox-sensitive bicupin YhaK (pirin superfamily)
MLEGRIDHGDSMGHAGTVEAGGVQWMTAGSGIVHQEMPKTDCGRMGGFQLWVNLPRSRKLMQPRYQEIPALDIPLAALEGGANVRIICGSIAGVSGPVRDIVADPEYFDVTLDAYAGFSHPVRPGSTAAAYVIGNAGRFDRTRTQHANRTMLLFGEEGESVDVEAGPDGVRFLFFSGRPLREPIAWRGPVVMNTDEELRQAFEEYRAGTFVRKA